MKQERMDFIVRKGFSSAVFKLSGDRAQIVEFKNNVVTFVDEVSREKAKDLFKSYAARGFTRVKTGKALIFLNSLNGKRYFISVENKEIVSSPNIENARIFENSSEAKQFAAECMFLKGCSFIQEI